MTNKSATPETKALVTPELTDYYMLGVIEGHYRRLEVSMEKGYEATLPDGTVVNLSGVINLN